MLTLLIVFITAAIEVIIRPVDDPNSPPHPPVTQ